MHQVVGLVTHGMEARRGNPEGTSANTMTLARLKVSRPRTGDQVRVHEESAATGPGRRPTRPWLTTTSHTK